MPDAASGVVAAIKAKMSALEVWAEENFEQVASGKIDASTFLLASNDTYKLLHELLLIATSGTKESV